MKPDLFFNPYRHFVGSFIPNWLQRRRGISPGAKLCYARLAQYAGKKTGIAWPARKTLAKELGVSKSQVDRYIIDLERHGLLHVTRRGDQQTNLYRFIQVEDFTESSQMRTRTPHIRRLPESAQVETKENQGRDSMKRSGAPSADPLIKEIKAEVEKVLEKCPDVAEELNRWLDHAGRKLKPAAVILEALRRSAPYLNSAKSVYMYLEAAAKQKSGSFNAAKSEAESKRHKAEEREYLRRSLTSNRQAAVGRQQG